MKTRTSTRNPTEQLWRYHKQKLETKQDSVRLRNEIVLQHQNLVRTIAHRVSHQCAEPYQDLEQMGMIGLTRAIERFDPTAGNAFSSFAVPYIRGAMLHFLRDHGSGVKIPRRWREANSEINRTERSWANLHGRLPSEQELADETGMKPSRIREIRGAIAHQTPISFEELERDVSETENYTHALKTPLQQSFLDACEIDDAIDATPQSNLERAWSKLKKNLDGLETSNRALVEALYYQRQPRKAIAANLQIDNAALKAKIQQTLNQLAS